MFKDIRVMLLMTAILLLCFMLPEFAFAPVVPIPNPNWYWDDPSTSEVESYGYNPTPTLAPPSGPHGGFTSTTNRCRDCHAVHKAASSNKLLRYATISDNCLFCHDATGGPSIGVPIRIMPQAQIKSDHYTPTSDIIGGDYVLNAPLTCTDCHSPHATPVRILPTSAWYFCDNTTTVSSHLLLRDPNPNNTLTVPNMYGGIWCSDCHNRRMSSSYVKNHPVSDVLSYASSSLARNSQQYFRMYPVEAIIPRTIPICQHCHEDKRDCEAAFTHNYPTGGNPFYNTFPHESDLEYFKVEDGDDMCTNCHSPGELP